MKNFFEHMVTSCKQRVQDFKDARERGDGFTLVEMTTIIAITGIMMPIIMGIMITSINSQEVVLEKTNGQLASSTVASAIENDLESATWAEYKPEGHTSNYNNKEYFALRKPTGECVVWAVDTTSGDVLRGTYTRNSGPTAFGAQNFQKMTKASQHGTANAFTVEDDGTVRYKFTVLHGATEREVSGSVVPAVAQTKGSCSR